MPATLPSETITLRGHHLLCLLAFSGEGYSPSFEAAFCRLAEAYARSETMIDLVIGPDQACRACPHLGLAGCTSPADGPEESVAALDREVLAILSLTPGRHQAGAIHQRLARTTPDDLHGCCRRCSWHGHTRCQEIIIERSAELVRKG